MRLVLLLGLVLAGAVIAVGQDSASAPSVFPYCGQASDGLIHIAPAYMTFAPPARGSSYTDPMYGCAITRLSDGVGTWKSGVRHQYSTMAAINADDTRVLLRRDCCGYYVADLQGNVVADPQLTNTADPRWSITDPNTFYYHMDNRLLAFNVLLNTSAVVQQFAQFSAITFAGVSGSKGDISEDGDHILLGDAAGNLFVYTFSKGAMSPQLTPAGASFEYSMMTPNNNVLVRWVDDGAARFQGVELYDANMNFLRQVTPYGAHAAVGRDLNGDEILVTDSSPDKLSVCGDTAGIEKIRLSDSARTCLLSLGWWGEVLHLSVSRAGTAIAEISDDNNPGTAYSFVLPKNWQSLWNVYSNELVMVSLDGTVVQRLAHHRSIIAYYWGEPRVSFSRDGRYAVFDSNFGIQVPGIPDYTDVYLIQLY